MWFHRELVLSKSNFHEQQLQLWKTENYTAFQTSLPAFNRTYMLPAKKYDTAYMYNSLFRKPTLYMQFKIIPHLYDRKRSKVRVQINQLDNLTEFQIYAIICFGMIFCCVTTPPLALLGLRQVTSSRERGVLSMELESPSRTKQTFQKPLTRINK